MVLKISGHDDIFGSIPLNSEFLWWVGKSRQEYGIPHLISVTLIKLWNQDSFPLLNIIFIYIHIWNIYKDHLIATI